MSGNAGGNVGGQQDNRSGTEEQLRDLQIRYIMDLVNRDRETRAFIMELVQLVQSGRVQIPPANNVLGDDYDDRDGMN
jgi:hypothetical protein